MLLVFLVFRHREKGEISTKDKIKLRTILLQEKWGAHKNKINCKSSVQCSDSHHTLSLLQYFPTLGPQMFLGYNSQKASLLAVWLGFLGFVVQEHLGIQDQGP